MKLCKKISKCEHTGMYVDQKKKEGVLSSLVSTVCSICVKVLLPLSISACLEPFMKYYVLHDNYHQLYL